MLFSCVLAHFWAWKVVPVLILHLFQWIFPPMSYFSCAHMGELLRHWFECYAQWLSQQLESEMMGWNSPWWAVTRARLAIELPEISPVLIVWSKALGPIRNSLLNVAVYVHSLAKKGKAKKKKKEEENFNRFGVFWCLGKKHMGHKCGRDCLFRWNGAGAELWFP